MYISSVAFGHEHRCYSCSSSTSMDDCNKNKKETDCASNLDRCGTLTTEFTSTKLYRKSCTTKAVCDAANSGVLKVCKAAGGTCKYDCCDKDLCNGGAAPMKSVLLMVICALVAFFR